VASAADPKAGGGGRDEVTFRYASPQAMDDAGPSAPGTGGGGALARRRSSGDIPTGRFFGLDQAC